MRPGYVVPQWTWGVYQIGEVQARSCNVAATPGFGGSFASTAQRVDPRGVGISSTRA